MPCFPDDQPGTTPYRIADNEVRSGIVPLSYELRGALIDATAALDLETSWNTDD